MGIELCEQMRDLMTAYVIKFNFLCEVYHIKYRSIENFNSQTELFESIRQ